MGRRQSAGREQGRWWMPSVGPDVEERPKGPVSVIRGEMLCR